MTEIEKAIITCEVKAEEGDADRVLTFVGSDETLDRADDAIPIKGWDLANYKKNPVFLWAHAYHMPPIGKAVKVWVDRALKALMFKIEFADAETYPFADTIYRLYKGGFMRAVSVGFMPTEVEYYEGDEASRGDQPRRRFLQKELLELSAAPVPCNPNALQNAIKAGCLNAKDVGLLEREFKAIGNPDATEDTLSLVSRLNAATQPALAGAKELAGKAESDAPVVITEELLNDTAVAVAEAMGREAAGGLIKNSPKVAHQLAVGYLEHRARKTETVHGLFGSHERLAGISQAELLDEMEYLTTQLNKVGISDQATDMAHELMRTLLRETGGDMPDDIRAALSPPAEDAGDDLVTEAQPIIQQAVHEALRDALQPLQNKGG